MKNFFTKIFLIALIVCAPKINNGQCEGDEFLDNCSAKLGDYTFLKSFATTMKGGDKKQEYSYLFSKGSAYVIVVCDQDVKGGKMIVNLYDRGHKLIASSYNKQNKKHYPSINYPCGATGIYYIETTFEGDSKGCGVSIIGFEKKK